MMTSSLNRNTSTEWRSVMQELTLHKEEVERLKEELEDIKLQFKQELDLVKDQVRDERERCERLEEQLNDMTELHQNEVQNIKSGVRDMEEKVQYQSEERLMDIKEHLQTLEAKVHSLEHQQVQQQYINIDGFENSDARVVFMKLLNAVITVIHVGLFIVGTVISLSKPFFRTKFRISLTSVVALVAFVIYRHQDEMVALLQRLGLGLGFDLETANAVVSFGQEIQPRS